MSKQMQILPNPLSMYTLQWQCHWYLTLIEAKTSTWILQLFWVNAIHIFLRLIFYLFLAALCVSGVLNLFHSWATFTLPNYGLKIYKWGQFTDMSCRFVLELLLTAADRFTYNSVCNKVYHYWNVWHCFSMRMLV